MSEQGFIAEYFDGNMATMKAVQAALGPGLESAAGKIAEAMKAGGKWLICGNGGSAADAQHLAAEMVGRLYKLERRGLPAIALTTDSSALTCIGNDYGYDQVFERQVEALGKKGDVLLGISTSGGSNNVIRAVELAKTMGIYTLGFTGKGGGRMAPICDLNLDVPAQQTSHVQECHIAMGHLLCFLVERKLLAEGFVKARG